MLRTLVATLVLMYGANVVGSEATMKYVRRARAFCGLACLALILVLPAPARAHPGSGIVVDSQGRVYFVDMVSGVWKLEPSGALTHVPGPAFHWMTIDVDDRFARTTMPAGSGGDVVRLGSGPTLLLASDFPIALSTAGDLYFPSHGSGSSQEIFALPAAGARRSLGRFQIGPAGGPRVDPNDVAAGPDGSVYYTENDAVRRMSRDGRVTTVAERVRPSGCASGARGAATASSEGPLLRGLAVDPAGNVFIAATACGQVLRISSTGQVATLPQLASGAWAPTGVALFHSDVYVLEFEHPDTDDRGQMIPRVRKITTDGRTTVLATVRR